MNSKQKILLIAGIVEWGLFADEIFYGLKIYHLLIIPIGIFGIWATYKRWYESDVKGRKHDG